VLQSTDFRAQPTRPRIPPHFLPNSLAVPPSTSFDRPTTSSDAPQNREENSSPVCRPTDRQWPNGGASNRLTGPAGERHPAVRAARAGEPPSAGRLRATTRFSSGPARPTNHIFMRRGFHGRRHHTRVPHSGPHAPPPPRRHKPKPVATNLDKLNAGNVCSKRRSARASPTNRLLSGGNNDGESYPAILGEVSPQAKPTAGAIKTKPA